MASEQSVLDALGRALWEPRPTRSDEEEQQLAFALGYPSEWHVVRTLETQLLVPPKKAADPSEEPATTTTTATTTGGDQTKDPKRHSKLCIVDRIYAGKPGTGCDMWYNHHGAMAACQNWEEDGADPFRFKGGHMLPRMALFEKGDKVEVLFEDDWFEAKILRRKEHHEGFRYQVYYGIDKSKQNGIPEERIRSLVSGHKDPGEIAIQMGLGQGWQAVSTGNNRWKITAPNGKIFTSKKTALSHFANETTTASSVGKDEGDPPWRTTDHEYLGRLVLYAQEHAVSARRTITVEQIGKVTGWISESDVDTAGQPGYVSEKTGLPAKLFHVVFDDEAHLHRYGSYLVESQDMEEFELQACLIPEDQVPAKKARKSTT